MWEGVKRWDAFWLGALFDFFLVSRHLLDMLLRFFVFLGSLFIWCCFLPFFLLPLALWRRGEIFVELVFGKDEKQCEFPGWPPKSFSIAIPYSTPLFTKAWCLGSLFSIWASPCEPVTTFDISFFPSCFWPLALQRKGGIIVDWCSGRMKSSASSGGSHLSPSPLSSPIVPPFLWTHRVGEACSLFEPPLVSQ